MADPGFPRGGDANSPGGGPTYDFAKISQKLHEIERIWALGGGLSLAPPLDPPLVIVTGIKLRSSQNIFIGSKGGGDGGR